MVVRFATAAKCVLALPIYLAELQGCIAHSVTKRYSNSRCEPSLPAMLGHALSSCLMGAVCAGNMQRMCQGQHLSWGLICKNMH